MKAHLAAAATGIQVGAALVGSAAVVGQTGSGMLGLARYAVALLILAPVAWHIKGPPIAPADRWPVALIGIGQFGVLIALLNVAVRHIPSAQAALIFATLPLVTLVLAARREHQPIDRRALFAIFASVVGVATLLGGQARAGAQALPSLFGLACAALATLTGALCSMLYRPYLQRYGVVRVSALAMAASLPPLAVLALVEGVPVPPVVADGHGGGDRGGRFVQWCRLPDVAVRAGQRTSRRGHGLPCAQSGYHARRVGARPRDTGGAVDGPGLGADRRQPGVARVTPLRHVVRPRTDRWRQRLVAPSAGCNAQRALLGDRR